MIAQEFGIKKEKIFLGSKLIQDFGMDSLDAVALTMALEEEFDLEIPDEDAEKIQTVQQIVEYISKARGTIPRFEKKKGAK